MTTIGDIDKEYTNNGKTIIGVDDVGRGCIAGNLYLGFVSLNILPDYKNINDSKKLSNQKRLDLDNFIRENSKNLVMQVSVEQINTGRNLNELVKVQIINGLNILTNSMHVNRKDIVVFLDGLDNYEYSDYNVVKRSKFDSLSYNVAAASILAKNIQVSAMLELDKKFPQYAFSSHNGYGTKKHKEAIEKYGLIDAHRRAWIK